VAYSAQLQAKQNLVTQAIARIGGMENPSVEPILPSPSPFGYRNKATYPLSRSSSGKVQAGYYEKNSHNLVNINQCPVQDPRLNPLLAEVKQDIQDRGWSIYNETEHRGNLRHLALQIGRRTGQILLTLVSANRKVMDIEAQAEEWLSRYPDLVGVCLNYNPNRTNAILGEETRCVAGQSYFVDEFAGVELQLRSDTFFQVNPETAEVLLEAIASRLDLQGTERLVDAYCGIGTFTLPLAKRVKQATGLEINPAAIAIAQENARLNGLTNVSFHEGSVEKLLPQLETLGLPAGEKPDIVLLDPPRKGCDRSVLETLIQIAPQQIVYISCKPSTLARDLKILCDSGIYRLSCLQPADFFPQTSHVEAVAFLVAQG
jgi:23S rRNA (uracil1939-C5)-methyltransferase